IQATPSPHPTSATAPRFVGLGITTARALADRVGVKLEEESRKTDEADPGKIIDQDPAFGERLDSDNTVHVVVAQEADTLTVPDVRGETEENAIDALIAAGLVPGGRFRAYN